MENTKTLSRVHEGKVFTGVCSGLAEHFNMEVQTVRILYVVASLLWALPILIYIILSFALPVKEFATPRKEKLEDEYAYDPNDYKL